MIKHFSRRAAFLSALLLMLLVQCRSANATTIRDATFNFTLDIPDRFHAIAAPGSDTIYAFATSDPATGIPDEAIVITRLHGTIGREHLSPSNVPIPGATVGLGKWKTFDVDVIHVHLTRSGVTVATCAAQIPLKHEAIQISVAVPLKQEAQGDIILNDLLAHLDGPSNWLTSEERTQRLIEGGTRLAIFAGIPCMGVFAGLIALVVFLVRRKKSGARPQV